MSSKRKTHLEYYKEHEIAPVRYDMRNMKRHLERRESLYNMLGLLPLTFRGARVLEVAAGTGHNSLYVAAQMPSEFVLLEPNPTAVEGIHDAYRDFDGPHTRPVVVTRQLEEYECGEPFDIVLCENWLGTSTHEIRLLKKLSQFVAYNGIIVLTSVSPIGIVPNLLRRFLVPHLAPVSLEFSQRCRVLTLTFRSHLLSLGAMTRSATDWVQDNMLNPAYFGLCLSIPTLFSKIGKDFEVVASYPSFVEDWRWFKGLYGKHRRRNEHFIEEYWCKCHNYLDSNAPPFSSDPARNREFEKRALRLLEAIEAHEDAHLSGGDVPQKISHVLEAFDDFLSRVPDALNEARKALAVLRPFIADPWPVSPKSVSELKAFGSLFGRETSYVSLRRR